MTFAQTAPADAPPPPPAPPAETVAPSTGTMAPPPPPEAPPPPAPPSAVEAAPKPPTATETMPATRPDALPPIDVGAWLRIGGKFQGQDASKINDWQMDNTYVELHAGGKVHKNVGVTLNLNANVTSFSNMSAALEDAIISFDFVDEFHLWAGHLLVPVDRANASGPFFMIPWNYPGFFSGPFVGAPAEGPSGRNNGAVVWGDIAGGKFSYFAGAFDNAAGLSTSPLFSGKLRLALWDPEPGFWGNASYFGDKDMLSIDLGGQIQKNGVNANTNYEDVNVDVLVEKKLGGGSFATFEAAYYHFNQVSGGVSDSMYALLAYATPTVGIGNIQPMVRFQWEKVKDNPDTNPWNLDVGLSYLIKGPALRLLATYSYTKLLNLDSTTMSVSNSTANSIQLGAQAIFF
ncbi:MAG TPA: hypothetical protein VHH90_01050 [Polyangia bacterium]|nr:hypothetical protein [Polyangia bacterium]